MLGALRCEEEQGRDHNKRGSGIFLILNRRQLILIQAVEGRLRAVIN